MNEKDLLLELRKKIAKSVGQATYLVYNDQELEMLLKERPKTIEELTKLKGFPKNGKRVAAYGNVLVSIFSRSDNPNGKVTAASDLVNGSNVFAR